MVPKGWYQEGKSWYKVLNAQASTPTGTEVGNYDDMVRHIVTITGEDYGWVLKRDNEWGTEPLAHVRTALESFGLTSEGLQDGARRERLQALDPRQPAVPTRVSRRSEVEPGSRPATILPVQ
jgi:hypothetical protein